MMNNQLINDEIRNKPQCPKMGIINWIIISSFWLVPSGFISSFWFLNWSLT